MKAPDVIPVANPDAAPLLSIPHQPHNWLNVYRVGAAIDLSIDLCGLRLRDFPVE
jgi:hypothetical protein